jgi:hypothetical protein
MLLPWPRLIRATTAAWCDGEEESAGACLTGCDAGAVVSVPTRCLGSRSAILFPPEERHNTIALNRYGIHVVLSQQDTLNVLLEVLPFHEFVKMFGEHAIRFVQLNDR